MVIMFQIKATGYVLWEDALQAENETRNVLKYLFVCLPKQDLNHPE